MLLTARTALIGSGWAEESLKVFAVGKGWTGGRPVRLSDDGVSGAEFGAIIVDE